MPNGRPGDHPLSDLFTHDAHPFPADIEALIRKVHALDPSVLTQIANDACDWERGENLDQGRRLLGELIARLAAAGR